MTDDPTVNINPSGSWGSTPIPDPTKLTDAAIERATISLMQYIDGQLAIRDQRMDGIDEATKLRMGPMDAVGSVIDEKVRHLDEVVTEKFAKVEKQLEQRDVLAKTESNLNSLALQAAFSASKEAVAAALTAQKEAASAQDQANARAIAKSEASTSETIKTNLDLTRAVTDALTKGLDEVKTRVTTIESMKIGAKDDRSALYAGLAALGGLVSLILILAGLFLTRGAPV